MNEYKIPESSNDAIKISNKYSNSKTGKCIDDFFIQKIISKKGNNFVAKVKSKLDTDIYVMKRIDKNKATQIGMHKYISREEEFLKILNHENIVKYITSFEDSQFLYLITEYVENGDLLVMINSRNKCNIPIGEEKLMKIFLQCLKSLSYIHSCGIILRALKPDKILIDNENNIKITNFKYAAIHDEDASKTKLNITNEKYKELKHEFETLELGYYQPPEMKKGNIYDKKIDVYSLGIIFTFLAYNDIKVPENNNYSKELGDFINKMINKKPLIRPTAKEAYEELKNIYLKKYSHNTGIISCLRCLTSLPNLNTQYFLNKLLGEKQDEKDSILKSFINFIMTINEVIQSSKTLEDFSQRMEKELNLAIYEFLEQLHKRGCINLNKFKEISLINFLFLLFSLLERDLKLNCLNVDVNFKEMKNEEINMQFEDKEKGKLFQILSYFNVTSIINQCFSIISKTKESCANCGKGNDFYKKNQFISFNVEKIKKLKKGQLNIINAFECMDSKIANKQKCEFCNKETEKNKKMNIYNISRDLLILFDRGENCKNKDLIDFEMFLVLDKRNVELIRSKNGYYSYELYGVIIRREKNDPSGKNKKAEEYIYYTRNLYEYLFTRNDRRETYNLTQIKSEGDIMALFYYCKDLDIAQKDSKNDKSTNNYSKISDSSKNIIKDNSNNINDNNPMNNNFITNPSKNQNNTESYRSFQDNNINNNINNNNPMNNNFMLSPSKDQNNPEIYGSFQDNTTNNNNNNNNPFYDKNINNFIAQNHLNINAQNNKINLNLNNNNFNNINNNFNNNFNSINLNNNMIMNNFSNIGNNNNINNQALNNQNQNNINQQNLNSNPYDMNRNNFVYGLNNINNNNNRNNNNLNNMFFNINTSDFNNNN